MTPLVNNKVDEKEKLLQRKNTIMQKVDQFIEVMETIHSELSDFIEEYENNNPYNKDVYKTKVQLREREDKKAREIVRIFKSVTQKNKYAALLQDVYKCVVYWLDTMSPLCTKKQDKSVLESITAVPLYLAGIMFLLGDYYKACNILKSYLAMNETDSMSRCLLLRWTVFLGENRILEKRLEDEKKFEKKYKGIPVEKVAPFLASCKVYKNFIKNEQRDKAEDELTHMLEDIEARKEHTYSSVELQTLLYYMISNSAKQSKVTAQTSDSLWCLQQRYQKCESILKNRLRGLFNDEQRIDFSSLRKEPVKFLEAMSSYAEYSDALRDATVESFNLGFIKEAIGYAEIGLKAAFKLGSFTRAIQMTNLSLLCLLEMNQESAMLSIEMAKIRLYTLTTSNRVEPASPARCNSPARQLMQKLQESFEELSITSSKLPSKRLHDFKKDCQCELCCCYVRNVDFAVDVIFSVFLYHGLNEVHMAQLHSQFIPLREKVNNEQTMFYGIEKKGTKMKPPQWLCEVYGISAVRWLRKLELDGRDYLRDTKKEQLRASILEQVKKFIQYGPQKFLPYYLACCQMKRHDVVGDCSYMPYTWMKPSSSDTKLETTSSSSASVLCCSPENVVHEAFEEYSLYSHLLYRDWRVPICTFIGRFSEDSWLAAMMFAESTVLTTRSNARLVSGKLDSYAFSRLNNFTNLVQSLPRDFTIIQIATDENGHLFMIKLFSERKPIILPIAHKSKVQKVNRSLASIIKANEASTSVKNKETPAKFWENRREVENKLKVHVQGVEEYLFHGFAPMLFPSQSLTSRGKQLASELYKLVFTQGSTFDLNIAEELVSLCQQISNQSLWDKLVMELGVYYRIQKEKISLLCKEFTTLQKKLSARGVINKEQFSYTFLAICPILAVCPLESMDIFKKKPHVGRIVSIHALFRLVMKSPSLPREVDFNKSYYVLDPDNNLLATRERMTKFLSEYAISGKVGSAPPASEFKTILQEKDILFYLGHGSGSKHFSKRVIKESKCNAVSVLMGCGSVSLEYDGWGLDGRSTIYDYTVANCPAVVGCLWMVTDGEIDRFFMALVKMCFSSEFNTTINDGQKRLRSLLEAMRKARNEAKLPYLTGAAVVNYGLPVISCE